ncbi:MULTISPECIES: HD family hydrolase [Pantoea]|uniref:HD family hydrolase n=1 Tax=Candidatus Pantoea gossypiicola TaxID=2608008 RepID=A0AB34CRR5_9GAMM|nr:MULTISPECIES: HD family hydrolase [Pantoea]KAA5961046.1 HD family hydrolase [Pantoea sp. VH_24]KAA5964413.1 HD family hydrolase [Pantoea sp. VH_16]KAA5968649.1 HD family hydrolase [Pantoea sp. VH_18]KAA6004284.1 HD family hydrolase [Pantoea sp. M_1]KAA6006768.1 HD family hydrolase [Pantoea sp. F_7]
MSWITTLSGKHFNFHDISPDAICIEDIAGALSKICRFTGHIPEFYSVAQHSVHVSYLVPPEFALEALLHDAAEAYCNDLAAPLKQLLPDYQRQIEEVEVVIAAKFGVPFPMSSAVKHADLVMLATERRDLDLDDGTPWPILEGIEPAYFILSPLNPRQSFVLFLQRFADLNRSR